MKGGSRVVEYLAEIIGAQFGGDMGVEVVEEGTGKLEEVVDSI